MSMIAQQNNNQMVPIFSQGKPSLLLLNLEDTNHVNEVNEQNIVNNHKFTHNGLLVNGNFHDV